jgi:putative membrane protein (TIGR04086 family)
VLKGLASQQKERIEVGNSILRGLSTALLVTLITVIVGILWFSMRLEPGSISIFVDIGLIASCLAGGYHTGVESRSWILGGVTGACYVMVGTVIMALFMPVSTWGALQVTMEGGALGLVAGILGKGGGPNIKHGLKRSQFGRSGVVSPGWNRYFEEGPMNRFADNKRGCDVNFSQPDLTSPQPDLTSSWHDQDLLRQEGYASWGKKNSDFEQVSLLDTDRKWYSLARKQEDFNDQPWWEEEEKYRKA